MLSGMTNKTLMVFFLNRKINAFRQTLSIWV